MENYFDLGRYSRPITTGSTAAQTWFDRGLIWCYGFHRTEAVRCFQKVVALDPDCAMGYWGMAYAMGPYYNISWVQMAPSARVRALRHTYEHACRAQGLAAHGTPAEQALCQAFTVRYAAPHVDDDALFAHWDDAYAHAMRAVYAQFPHDYDVCALTSEALMCRTPWQLWDLEHRTPAEGADTAEAVAILETAMQRAAALGDVPHPGLLHFYIHCMEMSPEPERALGASNTLQTLVPDSGHLTHMPSHIYIQCGQYARAIEANLQASIADAKYVAIDSALGVFTISRLHNLHFQVYGALFSGQYAVALRAANLIQDVVTPEALRHEHQFLVNRLEGLYGTKAHVLIRFGKWQEILDEPMPENPTLFCVTTANWRYAKGIAYAVLGHIDKSMEQQQLFREALATIPEGRVIYHNESRDILAVAAAMLEGELAYRREKYAEAFVHLRRAVALYDTLHYSEPWAWMQPPRHALGALLLEQGHVVEAAQVYRADLGLDETLVRPSQHMGNVWSLHGYAECCRRLGQVDEAAAIALQLEQAQAVADIPIHASCFCRQVHECCDELHGSA
jgi:tetratricopeptide (TPR) repeat protein